jgi:hypothetical protein
MDTRTGQFHELAHHETLAGLARRIGADVTDLVEVARMPPTVCPRCKGKGSVPRGLGSKRFKPCVCVALGLTD